MASRNASTVASVKATIRVELVCIFLFTQTVYCVTLPPIMPFGAVRCLATSLLAIAAPAMNVVFAPPPSTSATTGGFVTALSTITDLSTGMSPDILALFRRDYPGFDYVNAAAAVNGTLTIISLAPFQSGLGGGLSIDASFVPDGGTHASHAYEWMQYLTINPLSTPFLGADSSPFTDPPPNARDDNLPFYWTMSERNTPGLGFAPQGNVNDDILFSDAPRVSDSRAPVSVQLFLYLADFDSTANTITIYDGVEYGFQVTTPGAAPEPDSYASIFLGITGIAVLKLLGLKAQHN